MGRLTQNVRLSFAQFEREVTAERIRDKIATARQRGPWMGGTIPNGDDRHPDSQRRNLLVNPDEAATVRTPFALYDGLGGIGAVAAEAERLGLCPKGHDTASNRRAGGGAFARGHLHYLLTNQIYIGCVRHQDRTYPGQCPAIIPPDLSDCAQSRLLSAVARPRRSVDNTTRDTAAVPAQVEASADAVAGDPDRRDTGRGEGQMPPAAGPYYGLRYAGASGRISAACRNTWVALRSPARRRIAVDAPGQIPMRLCCRTRPVTPSS
jgi:hypothetical protein